MKIKDKLIDILNLKKEISEKETELQTLQSKLNILEHGLEKEQYLAVEGDYMSRYIKVSSMTQLQLCKNLYKVVGDTIFACHTNIGTTYRLSPNIETYIEDRKMNFISEKQYNDMKLQVF